MKHDLTKFLDLEENNTSLQKENLDLRSRTIENLFRLDNGLVKVDDTLHKVQYKYVPGEIIKSCTQYTITYHFPPKKSKE